jgi:hypothetical protein
VGGGRQLCCFWLKIPWCERKCEMVCYHDAIASSPVPKVWGKVLAHFHKTLQQYAELTVWLARINSLWTIPLMSNKMMSMLLTLFLVSLDFFHWEHCRFVSRP